MLNAGIKARSFSRNHVRMPFSETKRTQDMRWKHLWLAALLAVATSSFASAQTTGQIIGTIADLQGAVLPGVTVTATSPQLQGERTAVTDSTGTFRIPTLPPGTYKVKVTLSGFQDLTQENVTVSLDKTATLN